MNVTPERTTAPADQPEVEPARINWLIRLLRGCIRVALWFLILIAGLWSVLALYYSNLPKTLRMPAAVLFVVAAVVVLFFVKRLRLYRRLLFFGLVATVVVYWLLIPASNDRAWRKDVAVLPHADINGNLVTLHNIRDFDYRTTSDFDVHYYDKTFDLDKLRTVDFLMSFWAPMPFCHTMVSFGFEGGDHLCVSIETRPTENQGYSPLAACFKQFELVYVAADERDVIRLRTNFRGEHVYLYRLNAKADVTRNVFLDYLKAVNSLRVRPEWYNALTGNCTSTIRGHTQPYTGNTSWSWKLVINGYIDELAYDKGALYNALPFSELKRLSLINDRAKAADKDPDFSKRIREGLPGISP